MTNRTFEVVAIYTVTPGREGDVLAGLRSLAAASRQEEGNLKYEYFQGIEDSSRIAILESYRTSEDFQSHRASAHFEQIAVKSIIPLLQDRTVTTYENRTI